MQLARVIGDVVSTIKDAKLSGHKLLVLQPIHPGARREAVGRTLIAVDATGAGVGEDVFFVRGKEASFPFLPTETPVDACVVGIVDHWDLVPGEGAFPAARGPQPVARSPQSVPRGPQPAARHPRSV
jgi:microcompartment protein CcmK/EutM